jgi:hypothetical protein
MIELDGLTELYGDKTAVDGLSFVAGHRPARPPRGGHAVISVLLVAYPRWPGW